MPICLQALENIWGRNSLTALVPPCYSQAWATCLQQEIPKRVDCFRISSVPLMDFDNLISILPGNLQQRGYFRLNILVETQVSLSFRFYPYCNVLIWPNPSPTETNHWSVIPFQPMPMSARCFFQRFSDHSARLVTNL